MNEWTPESIERLYQLYEQHIERLLQVTEDTNQSLGSTNPSKTRLEHMTRSEFEATLNQKSSDKEAIRLWILRIIRGHESEFANMLLAG